MDIVLLFIILFVGIVNICGLLALIYFLKKLVDVIGELTYENNDELSE